MKPILGSLILVMLFVGACFALAWGQSPGDTIGWTQYYYQTIGSSGHRIAVDTAGGVHFTWTCGDPYPSHRDIKYNYIGPNGSPWPGIGQTVSFKNLDGYAQIELTSIDQAVIVYHNITPLGSESLYCAMDALPGLGSFSYFRPPNRLPGNNHLAWPYITIDRADRIHLIATTVNGLATQPIGYTRSSNGGVTWSTLIAVDSAGNVSSMIISSPVSDKIAIVYCHPTDSTWTKDDVFYAQSPDGTTWDFVNGKINITGYGTGGDSLSAFTDVDATYDYNDNLHVTWNAHWVTARGTSNRVFLYHFDTGLGLISEITHADVPHSARCQFGSGNLALNKMSIASDSANGFLYVCYCRFDTSDCASDSTANGEIYFQKSTDGGDTWTYPLDLTNSHTPGCTGLDCASDICPSMAERVDTAVHIFYVCRRYPNFSFPNISSPMLYLPKPTERIIGVKDEALPNGFAFLQNYPNPFNAQTTIRYNLNESGIANLAIYNIIGQKVTTLSDGIQEAGEHQVIWDASGFPSGIYFARLEMAGGSRSIRMVLLK